MLPHVLLVRFTNGMRMVLFLWYVPPLSPIMSHFEGKDSIENPDMIFPAIEERRIPGGLPNIAWCIRGWNVCINEIIFKRRCNLVSIFVVGHIYRYK